MLRSQHARTSHWPGPRPLPLSEPRAALGLRTRDTAADSESGSACRCRMFRLQDVQLRLRIGHLGLGGTRAEAAPPNLSPRLGVFPLSRGTNLVLT